MALFSTHVDRDELGGGRIRDTIAMKAIAYRENGSLLRSVTDWVQGDATFPHVNLRGPLLTYMKADGFWRVCPTRDPAVYAAIGAPFILNASSKWTQVALGQATRSAGVVSWTTAQADVKVTLGGHFVKPECELKGGWVPRQSKVAFPYQVAGLTYSAGTFYRLGVPVMQLRAPQMYDAANPLDTRPIAWDFASVSGQTYIVMTLPSLTGMSRPVLDPTLTLQPGAADGKDTNIRSAAPTTNYGTDTTYYTGGFNIYRIPMQFDLSSIPAGVTYSSIVLQLYLDGAQAAVTNTVNRILAASSWTEAGATWNTRNGTDAWAGSAGCKTSGTDYAAAVMGTASAPASAGYYTCNLDATEFENMRAANYGMVIGSANSPWSRDASSDHATPAYRPQLVVTYTLPGGGARRMFVPDLGYLQVRGA